MMLRSIREPLTVLETRLDQALSLLARLDFESALRRFDHVAFQLQAHLPGSRAELLLATALVESANILRDRGMVDGAGAAYSRYLHAFSLHVAQEAGAICTSVSWILSSSLRHTAR